MSMIGRRRNWNKHCFAYCGPENCDCGAGASMFERKIHDAEEKAHRVLDEAQKKNSPPPEDKKEYHAELLNREKA